MSSIWYRSPVWLRVRKMHLANHPMCVFCQEMGTIKAATVVDHIKPHRGEWELFIDSTNLQSLCATCHSGRKQKIEATGKVAGCDINGIPIDKKHHWKQKK